MTRLAPPLILEKSDAPPAGRAENGLRLTPASKFCAREIAPIDWLVPRILATGGFTVVYGAPKVGKTTFITHLVAALLWQRPFLHSPKRLDGPAIWLDLEQPTRVSQRRFSEVGAGKSDELLIYRGSPPRLADLFQAIDGHGARLVVADSLSRWLLLENENDNAEITRKLAPVLVGFHERDVALLVTHHDRKSEGATGRTMRGGSALLAACDVAVEMKAEGPIHAGRRRLWFTSREEPTEDIMVRLDESGVYVIEATGKPARQSHEEAIVSALRSGERRKGDLAEYLGISTKTLEHRIEELVKGGQVIARQLPERGAPIEYRLRNSEPSENAL